jgi:hypothetical protein
MSAPLLLTYEGSELALPLVQPGDILMGHDGTPRRVVSIHPTNEPRYYIEDTRSKDDFAGYSVNASQRVSLYNTLTESVEDIPLSQFQSIYQGYIQMIPQPTIACEPYQDPYLHGFRLMQYNRNPHDEEDHDIYQPILDRDSWFDALTEKQQEELAEHTDRPLTFPPAYHLFSETDQHKLLAGVLDSCDASNQSVLYVNNLQVYRDIQHLCVLLGVEHVGNVEKATYTLHETSFTSYHCSLTFSYLEKQTYSLAHNRWFHNHTVVPTPITPYNIRVYPWFDTEGFTLQVDPPGKIMLTSGVPVFFS